MHALRIGNSNVKQAKIKFRLIFITHAFRTDNFSVHRTLIYKKIDFSEYPSDSRRLLAFATSVTDGLAAGNLRDFFSNSDARNFTVSLRVLFLSKSLDFDIESIRIYMVFELSIINFDGVTCFAIFLLIQVQ